MIKYLIVSGPYYSKILFKTTLYSY